MTSNRKASCRIHRTPEWSVRSSETFMIRKVSPDLTPTSSVFDLERYVGSSLTSLYGEEEVTQLPIFTKSSDSLEALINEVFKDANDAILLGREMTAPNALVDWKLC